jgi:hypothetical protein
MDVVCVRVYSVVDVVCVRVHSGRYVLDVVCLCAFWIMCDLWPRMQRLSKKSRKWTAIFLVNVATCLCLSIWTAWFPPIIRQPNPFI